MVKIGVSSEEQSLRIRASISSGPVAFLRFFYCRNVLMPVISPILGYGVLEGLGIWSLSSLVEVDWYWRISMLALSLWALKRRSLYFNVDSPVLSLRNDERPNAFLFCGFVFSLLTSPSR